MSKSIFGLSYRDGNNEFNGGFRGLAYSSRNGFVAEPGLSYNRYLTRNGFYAFVGYSLLYLNRDQTELVFNETGHRYETTYEKGWHSDLLFTGIGKSFQFTRWGLHADAGIMTTADSDIGKRWGWSIGGAASYRFKLGD